MTIIATREVVGELVVGMGNDGLIVGPLFAAANR